MNIRYRTFQLRSQTVLERELSQETAQVLEGEKRVVSLQKELGAAADPALTNLIVQRNLDGLAEVDDALTALGTTKDTIE